MINNKGTINGKVIGIGLAIVLIVCMGCVFRNGKSSSSNKSRNHIAENDTIATQSSADKGSDSFDSHNETRLPYVEDNSIIIEDSSITPEITEAVTPIITQIIEPGVSNNQDFEPTVSLSKGFILEDVPDFSGKPYYKVNNDVPFFTEDMLTTDYYESYGKLDALGRCTSCIACIGEECMPTESRGTIGQYKPTGWHTVKYKGIDGNYLYNRCHLIGYQLTAENSNPQNMITGTRYMNIQGMLYWEDITAWYIRSTGNHVLYRSTPIFVGDELLARGVLIEAVSVEDNGAGIQFCEFCYNVQPGVIINYATGDSEGEDFTTNTPPPVPTVETKIIEMPDASVVPEVHSEATYILNKRRKKFHRPACSGVESMSEHNKEEFYGTREEAIAAGYSPCGTCKP